MSQNSVHAVALVRFPGRPVAGYSGSGIPVPAGELKINGPEFIYAPFNLQDGIIHLAPNSDLNGIYNYIAAIESNLADSNESLDTPLNEYCRAAEAMLELLKKGDLRKVILSRIVEFPHNPHAKAVEFFELLCEHYPNACVHLFAHPSAGIWIGASPEVLIEYRDNRLFTAALAGTMADEGEEELDEIEWQLKELEEHEMVSEFIANVMWNQPGITWMQETKPETIRAGAVLHLLSRFEAQTLNNFEWWNLVQQLHPTPAICGIPTHKAQQTIEQLESHKRLYYTGFFGTVDQNSAQLYVNLRCLRWLPKKVQVFVGGGYTASSQVNSEWEETRQKAATLLNVLNEL